MRAVTSLAPVLASKRKETVQKAFSIVHHERGDARLGHGAKGSPRPLFRQCGDINYSDDADVPDLMDAICLRPALHWLP